MTEEMKTETMELCVTACEKFSTNYEVCVGLDLSHASQLKQNTFGDCYDCLSASVVTNV